MAESGPDGVGAPGTGIVQLFPIFLHQGMQIANLGFAILPWGSPGLSVAGGTTSSALHEPMVVLAYEWPVPWVRVTSRIGKAELEALHVHRFASDHRLALGLLPFAGATSGGDPPDFEVATDAGSVGVDCTAFTIQERREAHALFANLRRRIAGLDPAVLAHLSGYMVYVWFPGTTGMRFPFKPNDEAAIDELLHALLAYQPSPNQLVVLGDALPDPAPDPGTVTTPSGASFYAAPFFNSAPDTLFAATTGFELGLAYTTAHSQTTARAELTRLVQKHDKPGVEWLLISAGAPNRDGQTFVTEEVVGHFLLDHPQPLATPKHIRRVTIHFWSTGGST